MAAAAVLAACGGSDASSSSGSTQAAPAGRTGGTIVWGKSAEAPESDPTPSTAATSWQLLSRVYEGLVAVDGNLRPVPKLASSWEQTSPTTWVFTIRRGVKFSNGREMTVDDVVGSLKRLLDPRTAAFWASQLGTVKQVSAKGDSQVEIALAKPNAYLLPALAGAPAVVLPMKELKAGTFDPRRELLGTGPFKVASHSQDEVWNLVRNPYYWQRDEPKIDKLTVRIMPDDAARIAGLRNGTVDVVNFDTPDAVQLLKGQPNVKTVVVPTTDYYRLDVNATTSIFRDPRLREALSLAIDRDEISKVALSGTSEPTAAAAPGFGVCDAASMPYATPDTERAAQLVEQAGAKGKTVSIIATSTYKPFSGIAQVLQQRLKAIGLNANVEQPDQGELLKRVYSGRSDFDVTISYTAGLADPAMVLLYWLRGQPWNSAWNPADDAQLAQDVQQSSTQTDSAARGQAIHSACERIARDAIIIPLVTKPVFVAYRSDRANITLPKTDAYSDPLNQAAGFWVNGG